MVRHIARLLAATLLGVAAGAVVSAGPAAAASCAQGTGVTVVVGSDVRCDSGGGGTAASSFSGTGHSLTYVNGSGFVCKVDDAPSTSCARTPPADAYWGLFWSDGSTGKWTYASEGVGSLDIPKGGWVAFVFQSTAGKTYPSVTPLAAPAPKPKPKPTSRPTPKPAPGTSSSSPKPSASTSTPVPSASTKTPKPGDAKTPSATPSVSAAPDGVLTSTAPASRATADEEQDGSGSLGWAAGILAVLLVGGMGAVLWRRRAAGGPS